MVTKPPAAIVPVDVKAKTGEGFAPDTLVARVMDADVMML